MPKNFTLDNSKMVLITSKKTGRPHTIDEKVRQDMLDLWQNQKYKCQFLEKE